MFTGIVEELGRVDAVTLHDGGARLAIASPGVLDDAVIGASIAVNGCCLTVVALHDGVWETDAMTETLDRTTTGGLVAGDPVNLERPVRLEDRLGGHLVQGHVDGVGTVVARRALDDGSARITIEPPRALMRYIVEKGSITVDGVSLTVASVTDTTFDVALIPHTLAVTTLGSAAPGTRTNLEADVFAKYVERLLGRSEAS
jgi:riboflavin synthase